MPIMSDYLFHELDASFEPWAPQSQHLTSATHLWNDIHIEAECDVTPEGVRQPVEEGVRIHSFSP